MNIVLGILLIVFSVYIISDARKYNGIDYQGNKVRGYSVGVFTLIIGVALIFDLVQLC
jgi:hypothetical protein